MSDALVIQDLTKVFFNNLYSLGDQWVIKPTEDKNLRKSNEELLRQLHREYRSISKNLGSLRYMLDPDTGRLEPTKQSLMTSESRKLKAFTLGDHYISMDIVNCAPTVILQKIQQSGLFEKHEYVALKHFVEHRDEIFSTFIDESSDAYLKRMIKVHFMAMLLTNDCKIDSLFYKHEDIIQKSDAARAFADEARHLMVAVIERGLILTDTPTCGGLPRQTGSHHFLNLSQTRIVQQPQDDNESKREIQLLRQEAFGSTITNCTQHLKRTGYDLLENHNALCLWYYALENKILAIIFSVLDQYQMIPRDSTGAYHAILAYDAVEFDACKWNLLDIHQEITIMEAIETAIKTKLNLNLKLKIKHSKDDYDNKKFHECFELFKE